ncbi:DNA-binding protein [Streptomyces sp. NPDC020141]|uniref:nSTAND1 domain-containing NTPase n=1 Tax=Streptomyces sp. NPDC020141 TaxID=3365065 RepID=UPI0037B8BCA3
MGRREVPIDPDDGPVRRFAYELRQLRAKAGGPTYRAMARDVPYSVTTLSRAAAGEQLPSLAVALAYAKACGGDPGEWERRWHEATAQTAAHSRPDDDDVESPYQGLARFEPGDHDRFFGRDRLIGTARELVLAHRFAAVFGPSGSGKSSLLRAGLIPSLRADGAATGLAAVRVLTPGEHPPRTHAAALTPPNAGADRAAGDTLIVVDQFEEAFTLCRDAGERNEFIDRLLTARDPDSGLRVIIAVRADFYGRCAGHRALADALADTALMVGPMDRAELRETIVGPARTAGLIVERELTARMVADVDGEPGGLPLLSHALRETWRRRKGRTLTVAAYEAAGGAQGAIARTAEDVYAEFTPERQELARLILLRMITPGDGSQDTRRPVAPAELDFGDPARTLLVVERLARARLLTLDDTAVDLAHEALITAWPRLNAWIEEDRERLRAHRRLTEAAHAWNDLGRDPGSLYRGARLDAAREHFAEPARRATLTPVELAFLTASRKAHASERRRRRALLATLAALAVGVALALLAGVTARQERRMHEQSRLESEVHSTVALADSRRVTNPAAAMKLSLDAWRLSDVSATRAALMTSMTQKEQDVFLDPDPDPTATRRLSEDGHTLLTLGRRHSVSWDVRTKKRTGTFPGLGPGLVPQHISSDLRRLTVRQGDRLKTRDVRTGRTRDLTTTAKPTDMSPSGRILSLYDSDGRRTTLRVRDLRSGRVLLERLVESPFLPRAVVSPDDRLVALCLPGAPVEIRDLSRDRRAPAPRTPALTGADCAGQGVRFTPDSRRLVLVEDTGVRVWDTASGKELPRIQHRGLSEVTFSADGVYMTGTDGSEILLWRVGDPPALVFRYELPGGSAAELRLDLAEQRIRYLASATGNIVRSLSLEKILAGHWHRRPAAAAAFSRDGRLLATARMDPGTGRVRTQLVDGRDGSHLADLPDMSCPPPGKVDPGTTCGTMLAFSPDGRELAYGISDTRRPAHRQRLYVTDTATGRTVTLPVGGESVGGPSARDEVHSIAFTPDGDSLLAHRRSAPSRIETWDPRERTLTRVMPGASGDLIVQPGGDLLATSSGDLLDIEDGRPVRRPEGQDIQGVYVFSPEGRHLLVEEDYDSVHLRRSDASLRLTSSLSPFRGEGPGGLRRVSAAALTADGRTLAIAGADGRLQLWNTEDARQLTASLPTAGGRTVALAFSRDGDTLYAASEHTPPRAYDLTSRHAAERVEERWRALTYPEG